jgi:hypothetical protein
VRACRVQCAQGIPAPQASAVIHVFILPCTRTLLLRPGQALEKTGSVLGSSPLRVLPSKTAIMPVNRELMPRSADEVERCSRTVYAANIDKKVDKNDVKAFFESLCGGYGTAVGTVRRWERMTRAGCYAGGISRVSPSCASTRPRRSCRS